MRFTVEEQYYYTYLYACEQIKSMKADRYLKMLHDRG